MADQPEVDVSSLRAALVRANSERDEARGQVAERDRRITSETAGRITAEETAVDNAITAKEAERDRLKGEVARLNGEGLFAEAADVQYQMSEVAADLRDYGKQKTNLAAARANAKAAPVVQPGVQPQVPAARKAWFDGHPEFFTDKKFNARAMALHADAIANDVEVDSPAYYKFIDEGLGDSGSEGATRAAPLAGSDTSEQEITVDSPRSQPSDAVIPANAAPEKPQARAAGAGSFAAAPSRRVATPPAQRRTTSLTPDQADSALRLAASLKPELRNQADIYKWYADLMDSQSVRSRLSGAAA